MLWILFCKMMFCVLLFLMLSMMVFMLVVVKVKVVVRYVEQLVLYCLRGWTGDRTGIGGDRVTFVTDNRGFIFCPQTLKLPQKRWSARCKFLYLPQFSTIVLFIFQKNWQNFDIWCLKFKKYWKSYKFWINMFKNW